MKTSTETLAHIIRSIASYGEAITAATKPSEIALPWMAAVEGPAVATGHIRALIEGLQGTLAAYDAAQNGADVTYNNVTGWVIA